MIRREEIEKEAEEYASDVFVVDKIGNFGINMNEYDAFIDGAEWADKTMLDKACEWLYEYCRYGCCEYIEKNDFINDFRKAMEK